MNALRKSKEDRENKFGMKDALQAENQALLWRAIH
jgi:hypothetical protein